MPDEPREFAELTVEVAATLFAGTVLHLATTDGALRDRLLDAYGGVTMEVMRFADQLPGSFPTRINELHTELTGGAGPGGDGDRAALQRKLGSMTGPELTEAARKICFLADDLTFLAVRSSPGALPMD